METEWRSCRGERYGRGDLGEWRSREEGGRVNEDEVNGDHVEEREIW